MNEYWKHTYTGPFHSALLHDIEPECGLYAILDTNDNFIYIGESMNIKQRLNIYLNTPIQYTALHDYKLRAFLTAMGIKEVKIMVHHAPMTKYDRMHFERIKIKEHKPKLNGTIISKEENYSVAHRKLSIRMKDAMQEYFKEIFGEE